VLRREGALDAVTVDVELAPEAAQADADRAQMAKKVCGHLKSSIGLSCNVAVKSPGEVPRSQGKAVRVRDERKM
jgi:phenylacetate-CoA ligase